MRFVLPIIIVMVASGHGFMEVVDLALHRPAEYGHILHEASPMIDAFGGAFLIMIGLSYFIDYNKRVHWMRHVEPWLAKAGRFENFKVCLMLSVAVVLYFTKTNNINAAARVGTLVAKRAIEKGIEKVVFDRGGYLYQGKVQALADAAREAGLQF